MAPTSPDACFAAGPARPASPSARGHPCSTPGCRRRRSNRSWSTSPRGAGSARPGGSVGWPPTLSPATAASPASTPGTPTTISWRFPPRTTEVQFDEKWAFVAKKEAHGDRDDPADDHKGDYWDHIALDPEHRLVIAVVP